MKYIVKGLFLLCLGVVASISFGSPVCPNNLFAKGVTISNKTPYTLSLVPPIAGMNQIDSFRTVFIPELKAKLANGLTLPANRTVLLNLPNFGTGSGSVIFAGAVLPKNNNSIINFNVNIKYAQPPCQGSLLPAFSCSVSMYPNAKPTQSVGCLLASEALDSTQAVILIMPLTAMRQYRG